LPTGGALFPLAPFFSPFMMTARRVRCRQSICFARLFGAGRTERVRSRKTGGNLRRGRCHPSEHPVHLQNVKSLLERGFLTAREERLGEMPEKTIYTLSGRRKRVFLRFNGKVRDGKGALPFRFQFGRDESRPCPEKRRERLLELLRDRLSRSGDELVASLAAWKKKLPMADAILSRWNWSTRPCFPGSTQSPKSTDSRAFAVIACTC